MFSLCFMCICFLHAFCVGLYVLTCSKVCFYFIYKNYNFNECFLILSFILTPCPHTHRPVRILLNIRWQNDPKLGRVPCWEKCKSRKPNGVIFFHFFNLSISVIHVLRSCEKNGVDISKSGRECGSQSLLRFCFTRFSLIYFSDIYINAKYK